MTSKFVSGKVNSFKLFTNVFKLQSLCVKIQWQFHIIKQIIFKSTNQNHFRYLGSDVTGRHKKRIFLRLPFLEAGDQRGRSEIQAKFWLVHRKCFGTWYTTPHPDGILAWKSCMPLGQLYIFIRDEDREQEVIYSASCRLFCWANVNLTLKWTKDAGKLILLVYTLSLQRFVLPNSYRQLYRTILGAYYRAILLNDIRRLRFEDFEKQ